MLSVFVCICLHALAFAYAPSFAPPLRALEMAKFASLCGKSLNGKEPENKNSTEKKNIDGFSATL